MKKQIFTLSVIASAVAFTSCGGDEKKDDATKPKNTGIEVANIDSTSKPTDDFYLFVNGNWIKKNPIPAEESRWGSFNELNEKNTAKLRVILDEAANDKTAKAGSNTQKIGDFYSLAMDSVKLNKEGIEPLKEEFAKIESIKTTDDVAKLVAYYHSVGFGSLFGSYIDQDPKISTEYITQLGQGGISLPDRDYYTKDDERSIGIRKSYLEHLVAMFVL